MKVKKKLGEDYLPKMPLYLHRERLLICSFCQEIFLEEKFFSI